MIIYVDGNYKCHTENDGTMRAFEVEAFDGKCMAYIEGYRFIPKGESWVGRGGIVYQGEALFPWKDYEALVTLQAQSEAMADMLSALELRGVVAG